jgi:predicted DNA-binding transcriptional regulator AlpA
VLYFAIDFTNPNAKGRPKPKPKPAAPPVADQPTHAANKNELADHFGISRQSLYDMAKAGLAFPVKSKNGYNLADAKSMMEDFLTRRAKNGSTGDRAEKLRLECEKLTVAIKIDNERLKQAELETKAQQGKLVDFDHHCRVMDDIRELYCNGLDQIVESVAGRGT